MSNSHRESRRKLSRRAFALVAAIFVFSFSVPAWSDQCIEDIRKGYESISQVLRNPQRIPKDQRHRWLLGAQREMSYLSELCLWPIENDEDVALLLELEYLDPGIEISQGLFDPEVDCAGYSDRLYVGFDPLHAENLPPVVAQVYDFLCGCGFYPVISDGLERAENF